MTTREEAKFILANIDRRVCDDELSEALDMAIKALEQNPCEDCISRQTVIDVLKHKWNIFSNANDAIQESIDTIEALPPATPQQKTGHWIDCEILNEVKCSSCRMCFGQESNYCPNCGAKMESEDEE